MQLKKNIILIQLTISSPNMYFVIANNMNIVIISSP